MLRGGCRVRAAFCVDQEGERGESRVSGRRVDGGDIGAQAFICSLFPACDPVWAYYLCDRQWDQDTQAQVIQFRTITSPAELFSQ